MDDVFQLLAEPARRRIVELLRDGERSVSDLVMATGASQPTVSRHLRLLREGGVVSARVAAQRRLYRVRPEAFRALDAWLQPYRLLWSSRLDDLESHLEEIPD